MKQNKTRKIMKIWTEMPNECYIELIESMLCRYDAVKLKD